MHNQFFMKKKTSLTFYNFYGIVNKIFVLYFFKVKLFNKFILFLCMNFIYPNQILKMPLNLFRKRNMWFEMYDKICLLKVNSMSILILEYILSYLQL